MKTVSRWFFRFPLLSAIAIGIIAPLAFGFVAVKSCPHESGLFWLPLVSAECPGEFIGQLGFFITATPGLASMLLLLLLGTAAPPLFNFLDLILPANQEVAMNMLCLLPNLSVWWLVFSSIRRARHQNKNENHISPEN